MSGTETVESFVILPYSRYKLLDQKSKKAEESERGGSPPTVAEEKLAEEEPQMIAIPPNELN